MRVFALSDPHLALGTPGKEMDRFGPQWVDHPTTMARAWDATVTSDDLVLVPGDVSWASDLAGAAPDLAWLGDRPGTKVLLKGNHEHWWHAITKVRAALPEGVHALQGDGLRIGDVALCGTRLWDVPGVSWHDLIVWQGEPISAEMTDEDAAAALKVYQREVGRLDRALDALDGTAPVRIVMLHYPPVGPDAGPNELTERFERAGVDHVVYGHIHALDAARRGEVVGEARGVRYHLASCDWIDFAPVLVCEA
jgi:hypothetical protein